MRWRRLRKWAKWACTVAAVLAVGVAVVSRFYTWRYWTTSNAGDTAWSVGVGSGLALVQRTNGWRRLNVPPQVGWNAAWHPDWYWGYAGEARSYATSSRWHAGVLYGSYPTFCAAGASVLYPVALTLIPAALLWYADRRRSRPGSCGGCGYDRAGLAPTSPCPECGTSSSP